MFFRGQNFHKIYCKRGKSQLLRGGSASEDIRKCMRSGHTQLSWKESFWYYLFILMKHQLYLKTIFDICVEMDIVYKYPVTY